MDFDDKYFLKQMNRKKEDDWRHIRQGNEIAQLKEKHQTENNQVYFNRIEEDRKDQLIQPNPPTFNLVDTQKQNQRPFEDQIRANKQKDELDRLHARHNHEERQLNQRRQQDDLFESWNKKKF